MIRLKGLEGNLKYSNDKLINLDTPKLTLGDMFNQDNYFGWNLALSDDIMQLGWNTVGVFEKTDKGLKLTQLYKLDRDKDAAKNVYNVKGEIVETQNDYTQVVTRAVASCTFAHLVFDKTHVIAHLDVGYLERGFNIINGLINEEAEKKSFVGFCSRIVSDEKTREEDFSNNLKELCMGGYSELIRTAGNIMCGHMEIGLNSDADGVQLFGDISLIGNLKDDQATPSICFESQKELMEADLNDLINRKNSSGGGCVIL